MSAESWRKKRNPTVKAPSGDSYLVERPDPISLVQFLAVDCGLESPVDQKDLGEKIMKNPEIIAKLLVRYVKEPKLDWKSSEGVLSVEELLKDQSDCVAIIREIMSPFIEHADKVLAFFRDVGLSRNGG